MFAITDHILSLFSLSNILVNMQIESPFPPSEKLGIKAVQRVEEEIVPMKQMKMDWVLYIPFENRYYESSTWICYTFVCCDLG